MTVVALATLLLMPLATDGSMAGTPSLTGIPTAAVIKSQQKCGGVEPLPSLKLHGKNKCYVYGGRFLFDEELAGWARTAEACEKACSRQDYKRCYNWRFTQKGRRNDCYLQVSLCASDAKYKATSIDKRAKIKSGNWIEDAADEKTVAGPRQCIGPDGCYRHGVWYHGNDIGEIQKFDEVTDCQMKCERSSKCKFFVYVTEGFKSDVGINVARLLGHTMQPGSCIMKSHLGGDPYVVPGLVMGPKCCQDCRNH